MSRTSISTKIYGTYPRSVSKIHLNKSSSERYKIGQGRRDESHGKWSNDKVYDELSSFIAEFSYLTDAPKTSLIQKPVLPSPTYRVYAVHKDEDDADPFIHSAKSSDRSRSFRKDSKPLKKTVEWRDHRDSLDTYRRKRQSSPETPAYDTQTPASREGFSRDFHGENHRRKRRFRARSKSSASARGIKISSSRSRTRVRKVSRSRHRSKRPQSHHEARRIRSTRKRRKKSRTGSYVKHMPFYAQRRKSKTRGRAIIRKKEVRRKSSVRKVRVKKLVPHETPTIVTIYPNNRIQDKLKPDFLADASLTCKCFDCMKKYESLTKLVPPPALPLYCRPRVAPCTRLVCEPKVCYKKPCAVSLPDCRLLDSCCQFGDGYRSVSMKFNCIGQYLDSTITQYFHSILDQSIYC
uniref:Uncharacterized protein n=1 Tax=Graphocephala atropunctata TaxID=36148 RepID=A0A1B6LE05_9HEMI